jgi:hypothetical protein
MSEKETSLFERLQAVDVSKYVEKKQGLTYLSWAHAWRIFKEHCPDATYSIGEYHGTPELGYMCNTSVTAEGIKHCMWLPVMDAANKAMKDEAYTYETRSGERSVAAASMFDINKTAMRCLVKNLAMFGLGLYIYAGEDLPVAPPSPPKPAPEPPQLKLVKLLADNAEAKWFEIKPFSKGEFAGKELAEVVVKAGAQSALTAMEAYVSSYYPQYPLAKERLEAAILEARSNSKTVELEGLEQAINHESAGDRD